MNPTKSPADRPTYSDPNPALYGFPLAVWTLPQDSRTPFLNRLYEDAYAVLTEPDGEIARQWAPEIEEDGLRAITAPLPLPQIVSLVSELPQRAIVRFTGIAPSDAARQEIVRALYAEPED